MKHLFFVSVAAGIFSGTSISVAQTAVNSVKFTAAPQKKSVQFIEGIEIKRDAQAVAAEADVWLNKSAVKAAPVTTTKPGYKKTSGDNNNASAFIETCTNLQFKYAQLMDVEVEQITNTKLYTA